MIVELWQLVIFFLFFLKMTINLVSILSFWNNMRKIEQKCIKPRQLENLLIFWEIVIFAKRVE